MSARFPNTVAISPDKESARYAQIACLPCRTAKRRCDRRIPSCVLCTRKDIECSYPARRGRNAAAPLTVQSPAAITPDTISTDGYPNIQENAVFSRSPSFSPPPATESDTSAIYFIAPHLFQQAQLELPRPELQITAAVSSLIGDSSSIHEIANRFFTTIHRWLPIVSKKVFFTSLLNPLSQRRTELSLLALCMKLCCTSPSNDEGDSNKLMALYRTTKQFHQDAERAGILSHHVLQAGILILLHEVSHAIYPAAYLTLGTCARYGLAIGIDKFASAMEGDGDRRRSWIEVEERRRVWWAVLIFDRFLSLGNPLRPISTDDPTFDTYLPADDMAWDDCRPQSGDSVRMSTGFTLKMGSFARLAQATYLLSQALRSVSSTSPKGNMDHQDQIAQLRRTLLALVHAADSEAEIRRLEFCAQSAVSLSTILLLQEHHLQDREIATDEEHTTSLLENLCHESRTALERLSDAAASYIEFCVVNPDASDNIPIFVIHVMYQAACVLLRLGQGNGNGDYRDRIQILKRLLRKLSSRWGVAVIYLKILEAQEIIMPSEIINTQGHVFLSIMGPYSL